MRGTRTRFASDEGMTLVEVVVAAAILFFVMTAILGLVGRTTMMSLQARQISAINNAVNSYVEWTRTLPFDEVAEIADGGSLDSTTIPTGDFTVQIIPTVQENENQYMKDLWLAVTATRPDGSMRVLNTMVMIHDRDQYMTQSSQSPLTDPSIVFLAASPPDGTPVWYENGGSYWKDATGVTRPLQISVRPTVYAGRTVEEVSIQGEAVWDLEDVFGNRARWAYPTWTDSPAFSWDLNQKDPDGQPAVQEGIRTIYAYVKDSAGAIRYDIRQYVVDNKPPSATPWPLTHDLTGLMTGALKWPVVMDGSSPAYRYALDIRQQPLAPAATYGAWTWVPGYNGPETTFVLPGQPMGRYAARVRAYSPRGLTTYWSPYLHFVTRPKAGGTYSIVKRTSTPKGWTVNASLTATAPSFESTGTTYSWYEGETLLGVTTTNSFTAPTVTALGDPAVTPFPARTYTVVVKTTPLGLGGGTEVSVTSNAITTAAGATGTFTFSEGVW